MIDMNCQLVGAHSVTSYPTAVEGKPGPVQLDRASVTSQQLPGLSPHRPVHGCRLQRRVGHELVGHL